MREVFFSWKLWSLIVTCSKTEWQKLFENVSEWKTESDWFSETFACKRLRICVSVKTNSLRLACKLDRIFKNTVYISFCNSKGLIVGQKWRPSCFYLEMRWIQKCISFSKITFIFAFVTPSCFYIVMSWIKKKKIFEHLLGIFFIQDLKSSFLGKKKNFFFSISD